MLLIIPAAIISLGALADLFERLEDYPPNQTQRKSVAALPEDQRGTQGHRRLRSVPAGLQYTVAWIRKAPSLHRECARRLYLPGTPARVHYWH
jgi:hypothetical protein